MLKWEKSRGNEGLLAKIEVFKGTNGVREPRMEVQKEV